MNEFSAVSFDDFRNNYLTERSLDKLPAVGLGELSKSISRAQEDVAHTLNKWASDTVSRTNRYIKRLNKRNPELELNIRYIPVGDGYSGEAAIIVVTIGKETLEASIFDNNRITIKLTNKLADKLNKGRRRKFLSNKDKLSDYIIGALEKMA